MTQQPERPRVGHRVVATIKSVKGTCNWSHKAGDQFEVSAHDTGGMCGFMYQMSSPGSSCSSSAAASPPSGAAATA